MYDKINLDLEFSTTNSLVFTAKANNANMEIHIHMGNYNVIYISLIVSDQSIMILKDKKFLNYIDSTMIELEQKLSYLLGFLKKGTADIEVFLHVNYNSIRINFPPCLMFDDDFRKINRSLSSTIFSEIKKIPPESLY